tara:strand:+ start:10926 stop:11651 length:726 start_codon:yes stop_codon:yes gene_type:complete
MALPKLSVPYYNTKLPSDGRAVKYRPFLVKEEKLLFLAMESGDQEDMIDAVKRILTDCTNIKKIDDLATFDIEYLFLRIRASSVGETVEVNLTCPDDDETEVKVEIPLDDIKIVKNKDHTNEIKLSDDVIITMGYPSLDTFIKGNFDVEDSENAGSALDQVFDLAADCIVSIADTNQVYDCADTPKAEMREWFEQFNSKQFQQIQKYFETMPKLSHTLEVENPNTGVKSEVVIEGLASFFA